MRARCKLPEAMECPAPNCSAEFTGTEAWDQRMEHVARHLDRASLQQEPDVEFGGENDVCLTGWAGREDVGIIERVAGGGWKLAVGCGQGTPARGRRAASEEKEGGIIVAMPVTRVTNSHSVEADAEVEDEIMVKGEDMDDDDVDAECELDEDASMS